MLPASMTLLEAALWEAHARLDEARACGRGISAADDEAKALVASYLAAGPEHVTALRTFLRRLDVEVAGYEAERARAAGDLELAEADRRRFRAHALNALRERGVTSVRAVVGEIGVGRGRRTIEIRDAARVPEAFIEVIPAQRRVREKDVRAALEAGDVIPGVLLADGEPHLRVR